MRHLSFKAMLTAAALMAAMVVPAVAGDAPVSVTREDALRAVTSKVPPDYSNIAKQLKLHGVVEVEVLINEDGAVDTVTLGTGNPVLFNCAKEAVKKWKFTPFKADGKPTKAKTSLSFNFTM